MNKIPVAVLSSGGKDSVFAMYKMMLSNYKIKCLVTMKTRNPDSYMFHKPNINIARLQAKAIGLPLVEETTEGKKEEELKDLEKALKKAKRKFPIKGIVTGALYSNYQKWRVEKVAKKVDLKIYSPLWHVDQESYMREIINSGFKFILTKIAAEGLNKDWLGRIITNQDVSKLVELNKKIGINIAFEGGEAETLMIDGPVFKSRIIIKKAEKMMENKYTGYYKITKARLE